MSSPPLQVPGQTNYYVTLPRSIRKDPVPGDPWGRFSSSGDRGPGFNCQQNERDWARLYTFIRGFFMEGRGGLTQVSLLNDHFFRSEKDGGCLISRYSNVVAESRPIDMHNFQYGNSLYFDDVGDPLPEYRDLDPTLLVGIGEPGYPLRLNTLSAERKVLILSALAKRESGLRKTLDEVPADLRGYGMFLVDINFFREHFSPVIPTGLFPRLAERLDVKQSSTNSSFLKVVCKIGWGALFCALPLAFLEWGIRVAAEKAHLLYLRHCVGEDEAALMEVRHKVNQWTPIAACFNYSLINRKPWA